MIDRSRRVFFDQVADLYDQSRTSYPDELIEDILELSGIPENGCILEVGCGPGNATIPFAKLGYSIVAVELGTRLASLAAKNCNPYPRVEVRNTSFENIVLEKNTFDLAISADAFHWIPPEIGYPKLAGALKDSGSVALFWQIPINLKTGWSIEIDRIYQEVAPDVDNPARSFTLEWAKGIINQNFANSGCFQQVAVRTYQWSETFTADRYLNLMRTYSGHANLEEETRSRLYTRIRAVLEKFEGGVEKPFLVALFHARVKR